MTWIATVPCEAAEGQLRELYDRLEAPGHRVDNLMLAHSLRPHALAGHMALYQNVLDHAGNTLDRALLQAIGIWVSLLNGCGYGIERHYAGLRGLLRDDVRAEAIRLALEAGAPERAFAGRELALFAYAARLTTDPATLTKAHIQALRHAGLDDGQILEANQAVAYVAYANRTALGLGVTAEDEIVGGSPFERDDPEYPGQP
ncbi:MAG: carboxymuconolactone decarboxylase family protein [Geminicoccaceae bacterium]